MMESISFRIAQPVDVDAILFLNERLFEKEYAEYDESLDRYWINEKGRPYFAGKIESENAFVEIAERDNVPIGYLCGGIHKRNYYRKPGIYAELSNMFIDDKFRGKGIGTNLVEDFLIWCKNKKVDYLSVTASFGNKEAVGFYKKFGFKEYNLTLEKDFF